MSKLYKVNNHLKWSFRNDHLKIDDETKRDLQPKLDNDLYDFAFVWRI